jgi:hypothetical protein
MAQMSLRLVVRTRQTVLLFKSDSKAVDNAQPEI